MLCDSQWFCPHLVNQHTMNVCILHNYSLKSETNIFDFIGIKKTGWEEATVSDHILLIYKMHWLSKSTGMLGRSRNIKEDDKVIYKIT